MSLTELLVDKCFFNEDIDYCTYTSMSVSCGLKFRSYDLKVLGPCRTVEFWVSLQCWRPYFDMFMLFGTGSLIKVSSILMKYGNYR